MATLVSIYSRCVFRHFDETERAVEEMARVLKPGGRAIVGVPNRYDPFLRPFFATVLRAVGLYRVNQRFASASSTSATIFAASPARSF